MRAIMLPIVASIALVAVPSLSPLAAEPSANVGLYWYDGSIKVPIYKQPDLYSPTRNQTTPAGDKLVAEAVGLPPIYRSANRRANDDPAARDVYSTAADGRSSRLMVQGPGVMVELKEGKASQIQTWLANRGLRARSLGSDTLLAIEGVTGEPAIRLANALYESGLVEAAQPNWIIQVRKR
ncbi:hypothetical protein [Burkholderia ubonensis]|uniref:Uncharacterized protein n=1 Tax=Burkholderia ubonensis TaxID=101571 RepID=A0AAW3MNG4_9BURK|nr:hypothetical protein [Burkholderia ubonensis]KVK98986.1 hypothetical protein WJ45_16045 [Burkholderia ubonensis]KVP89344.1 hypothetical protein WJ96_20320 [Burkholderia ubonensis]KVQ54182.1 hypothetical protein WK04_02790 [Burkholderia ubonensis]